MNDRQFFETVLLGHKDAIDLCSMLGFVTQLWDDLIDGDPRPAGDVNKAFLLALCAIPQNSFYLTHQHELVPMLRMAIFDWLDATELEQDPNRTAKDLAIAYGLRDSMVSLVVQITALVGGPAHAIAVGPSIRRTLFDESFEDYKASMEASR